MYLHSPGRYSELDKGNTFSPEMALHFTYVYRMLSGFCFFLILFARMSASLSKESYVLVHGGCLLSPPRPPPRLLQPANHKGARDAHGQMVLTAPGSPAAAHPACGHLRLLEG